MCPRRIGSPQLTMFMASGVVSKACDRHDDVIKWKHFPRYWPFVRGIHRSTVNSPHKGQWRGALMFSLICAWINGWVNNRKDEMSARLYLCVLEKDICLAMGHQILVEWSRVKIPHCMAKQFLSHFYGMSFWSWNTGTLCTTVNRQRNISAYKLEE